MVLSRTAGDVLRCRTHFVRRGGSLIDLAILLLHASAGLGGDGGRLVCGATGILHRALNLGDDRLQLVQKTIEPARQLAQLIFFVVGKTPCQITFATGNVFQQATHFGGLGAVVERCDQFDRGDQLFQVSLELGLDGGVEHGGSPE